MPVAIVDFAGDRRHGSGDVGGNLRADMRNRNQQRRSSPMQRKNVIGHQAVSFI